MILTRFVLISSLAVAIIIPMVAANKICKMKSTVVSTTSVMIIGRSVACVDVRLGLFVFLCGRSTHTYEHVENDAFHRLPI